MVPARPVPRATLNLTLTASLQWAVRTGTAEYAAKHNRRNSGGGSHRRRSSIHRESRRSFSGAQHSRRNSGSRSPSFYGDFDASAYSLAPCLQVLACLTHGATGACVFGDGRPLEASRRERG